MFEHPYQALAAKHGIYQGGPMMAGQAATHSEYQRQRQMTLDNLLLENRIIFLQGPITYYSGLARDIVKELLYLQSENRRKEIHFYINSPGGDVNFTLAIYDTMQILSCPVSTYCVGEAFSGASLLLAAGAKGKRYALRHSRVMIHQPSGQHYGQVSDLEIYADEILRDREELYRIMSDHTGQSAEKIAKDSKRDFFLSASEAKEYGIVDEILDKSRSDDGDNN